MIRTQGRGVVYGELWFDEEPGAPLPDILICRQRPQPWPGARCEEFVTLQLDMTQEEQQLFDAFGKDNRYKIRRANDKDACVATFIDAPAAHLNAFCEFYDSFAVVRDLPPAHRSALQEAAACGQQVLTHAQQADATLVWHAYIVSGDHARLLHTASHFRSQNKQLQAVIGPDSDGLYGL